MVRVGSFLLSLIFLFLSVFSFFDVYEASNATGYFLAFLFALLYSFREVY